MTDDFPTEFGLARWLARKREIASRDGIAVARNRLAADVAVGVMRIGGTAIDAGIAGALALGVVEPHSGLGGNGVIVLRHAASGHTWAIDHYGRAPEAATIARFSGNPDLLAIGGAASVVPGGLLGLETARERFGTRPLAQLVQPAIDLAECGFNATPELVLQEAGAFPRLVRSAAARRAFLPDGRPHLIGETVRQPDLALGLRAIASEGPATLYGGSLGRKLVEGVRADGGIMTLEDLERVETPVLAPLTSSYGSHDIATAPGKFAGATLLQMLNMAAVLRVAEHPRHSPERLDLIGAIQRIAVADYWTTVANHGSDSEAIHALATMEHAERRCAGIATAAPNAAPGRMGADGNTSALVTADALGNVFAYTNTTSTAFGSGVIVEGVGFVMNSSMRTFSLDPASPNRVEPRARWASPMSPLIASVAGAPVLTASAMGGMRIPTTLFEIVLEVIDHGLGPQAAIDAPKLDFTEPVGRIDAHFPALATDAFRARHDNVELFERTMFDPTVARPVAIAISPDSTLIGGDYSFAEGGTARV